MRLNLHFISHTHWDREWYETFDAFRYRLVRLMDRLLDLLEQDPGYQAFLLDGQTIVLEDYLEIRPESRERTKKMVQSGRILIGPWYVLPDEFLVSSETHIRNLLFGKSIARDFGAIMNIGYLPDSFGHIAQMPQILQKSGIDFAALWRGVPGSVKRSEFYWKAPDGSQVLTLYMPFGYSIAAHLPEDKEQLIKRIKSLVNLLRPFATTSHLLLMNGSDHVEPDPNFPTKLNMLREAFLEYCVLHSNLPSLFSQILQECKSEHIPVYSGELRSEDRAYLLSGTLSTRIYLKQKHSMLSHCIEGQVEPLCTLLYILGHHQYPPEIRYLWKLLLQNSPHDSICGCSIDSVHQEMLQRYRRTETIIEKILSQALSPDNETPQENYLVVFNPHPWEIDAHIECDIFLERRKTKEVNFEESKLISRQGKMPEQSSPPSFKLIAPSEEISPTLLHSERDILVETPPHTLPEVFSAWHCRIAFTSLKLPPLGFKVYKILPSKEKNQEPPKTLQEEYELENEFYRLSFSPSDGFFHLEDKESRKRVSLRIVFEDGGDAGDEYDYSPPKEDRIISTLTSTPSIVKTTVNGLYQKMILQYNLSVPASLTLDRWRRAEECVPLPFSLDVVLPQKSRQIELKVYVENNACDHRLRILFEIPEKEVSLFSGAHFAILERKPSSPNLSIPQKDLLLLWSKEWNLAILNKGLQEFQYSQKEQKTFVAITLLRSVGWLSRDDLLTRKGDAGWPFSTPEAQCLGKYCFELAITLGDRHSNPWLGIKEALLFNRPPLVFQVFGNSHPSLEGFSLLTIDNPYVVMSALKKSEDRDEAVLRLYNPTPDAQHCRIFFGLPVSILKELSLLEEELRVISFNALTLEVDLNPYEIKTLGLLFAKKKQ